MLSPGMAAAAVFAWPTLRGPFVPGDDTRLILGNPAVTHPSVAAALDLLTQWHGDLYQPLPMLTFQANYALAGTNPASWHAVNLVLHMLSAALAGLLAYRLAGCRRIAALTAVLFACHPMAMDAVGWITGRILLMAAVFLLGLLNVFAWRRADAGGGFAAGSILTGVGALLCKVIPSGPIAAAWVDACAAAGDWSGANARPTPRGRPRRWWCVVGLLILATLVLTWANSRSERSAAFTEAAEAAGTSMAARMLLASRYYFENYLWPTRLTTWAPTPWDVPFFSTRVLIGAAEWAAVIAALAWSWRRNRAIRAGLGLFVILLAPFLLATGVRNFLTADRYLYLPMAGLHLAVAGAAVGLADRVGGAARRPKATIGAIAALAVVALWTHQGWVEAEIRQDIFATGRRAVELYPDDVRVRVKLAKTYVESGDADGALAVIADARQLWPDDPGLAGEAGAALRLRQDWRSAEAELRRAIAGQPDDLRARYHLGLTLDSLGRFDEARAIYDAVLKVRANYVPAATALARNRHRAGDLASALAAYDAALATNPDHRGALVESARILIALDDLPKALARAERVLAADAEDGDALLIQSEIELWSTLKAAPRSRTARLALHRFIQDQGRFDDLVRIWERAPGDPASGSFDADWLAWCQALLSRSRGGIAPPPARVAGNPYVANFCAMVRDCTTPSPASTHGLTNLSASRSAEDAETLTIVTEGLAALGRRSPDDACLLYATCVALTLQGRHDVAAMMRARLATVATEAAWREPLENLDSMIRHVKSVQSSTSP